MSVGPVWCRKHDDKQSQNTSSRIAKSPRNSRVQRKIANLVTAIETARTGEAEASASMLKAKTQVKMTPQKEKRNESEGLALLELLCEAVDKMSAAS